MAYQDLKSWIDSLVIVDPVDSTGKLGTHFSDIHWDELDSDQVADLYAAIMPVLERLVGRLRLGLRQSTLPLSSEGQAALDAILKLYRYAQLLLNLQLGHLEDAGADAGAGSDLADVHVRRVGWSARTILDFYIAYVDVPSQLFVDLHQFAAHAETTLGDTNPESLRLARGDYYALVLLALVNPYALGREEMEDIFDCLKQVADTVRLTHESPSDASRFLDLTGKLMPHIVLKPKSSLAQTGVYVDVGALYTEEAAAKVPTNCQGAIRRFLERLHFYFVRRDARMPSDVASKTQVVDGHSLITLGFVSVHHRLEQIGNGHSSSRTAMALAGLDWEGLEQPIRGRVESMPTMKDFKLDIDTRSDDRKGWDVADVDAPSLTLTGSEADISVRQPKFREPQEWQVINLSEGGFRLHWRLARDSHAAVDELILAEQDGDQEGTDCMTLGLGVVRWVRHLDADRRTIDMGVERITGRVVPGYAHNPAEEGHYGRASWPVIVRTDDNKQVEWVLLPLQAVSESMELRLVLGDQNLDVRLVRMRLSGQGFAMMEAERVVT